MLRDAVADTVKEVASIPTEAAAGAAGTGRQLIALDPFLKSDM